MTQPAGGVNAWDRDARFWDAFYGIVLVVCVLIVLGNGPRAVTPRVIAALAMAAMACCYLVFGRGYMHEPRTGNVRGSVYLLVLLALFAVAEAQTAASAFILLALCPQCFMAGPQFRWAVLFVIAFNAVPVVVQAAELTGRQRAHALGAAIGIAVLATVFAIVFGRWIGRIIGQSRERAELIGRLEATQAELAAANREAGMLAERQRLAGDIHDTIAQGFTSIVMLIQAAEPEIGRDDEAARRYLGMATRTARENLAEARTLVAALTPAHLESGSLGDALCRLAERTQAEHGLPAVFEVTGQARPLPATAEVVLLRVCQEALANVRRHAQAGQAWVRLAYRTGSVRLEVADDGAGFDPATVNGGYGLRGMRGRVGEGGGTLVVRSAPGEGTSVLVEVPG